MASTAAARSRAYLAELPPDRRTAISTVRTMILEHLPKGYRESMNWGMLCYEVPLEAIGRLIAAVPPETLIERSEKIHR
ncbi:MAG: hypothetical protein ACREOC_14115 [Gemmatimonadales bacterium]